MNRIQYTKEQESKLLEMALKLFPEYKTGHINGAFIYLNKGTIPLDSIPIFEFCMTYLSERLYNECYSLEVCEDIRNEQLYDCFINNHPVDYLYEEFKKLKI